MGESMEKYLWAKKNRCENAPMWLPLMIHLEDTMEICGRLFDNWLSDGTKDFLINSIDTGVENKNDLVRNLCRFLGAVHDIGKATAIFQTKKSFNGDSELDSLILENLQNAGFKNIDFYDFKSKKNIAHNVSGQYILEKFGVNFCVANIIGAHHGRPISKLESDGSSSYFSSLYQDDDTNSTTAIFWSKIHKKIFDWAMINSKFSNVDELPLISQPGQVILSGLLVMADWISSNEDYFPLIGIDECEVDSDRAELGFLKWHDSQAKEWEPQAYYDEIYKARFNFNSKDAQKKISEKIDEIDKPGIMIVEAPMGMGKTEAALVAVEQLAQKTKRRGMFFGLPTQATSNGIFTRVKDWLEHTSGGRSIRLIHGKAQLNEEFSNLPKSRNIHGEDGLGVNEWFAGRKLSILDDFTVGTIDQILLCALKQKHLMLRHLGLSNKIVVIDEAHAYDSYMNVYLHQALRWLGAYKVPVVILSATLPINKRNELLKFYMAGAGYKFKKVSKPEGFETNEAYPLLTYNDGQSIKQFSDFEKEYGRDYTIIRKNRDESEDIIKLIDENTPDGGVVGIIVNTVKKAQELFLKCIDEYGEEVVELLHSSFIATDRYRKEKQLLNTIGKKCKRPDFKIIIGTQVIEQSLDIDFDLLITDLAPMDLILQRMGRLHRHAQAKRPDNLKKPKVYVLNCDNYDFDKASTYVYPAYFLFRTEYFLPEKINLPNDISHLVQLVYSDKGLELDDELKMKYENCRRAKDKLVEEKKSKAEAYCIDKPLISSISTDKNLSDWIKNSNHVAEASDIKAYAQVRDSTDTIEVIALKSCEGGYEFFDKKGVLNSSDNKTAMEIAKRTIKLPNSVYYSKGKYLIDQVIEELEKYYLKNFASWNEQLWLKNNLAIVFDKKNEFRILDKILVYDPKYGLIVKKEDENERI